MLVRMYFAPAGACIPFGSLPPVKGSAIGRQEVDHATFPEVLAIVQAASEYGFFAVAVSFACTPRLTFVTIAIVVFDSNLLSGGESTRKAVYTCGGRVEGGKEREWVDERESVRTI